MQSRFLWIAVVAVLIVGAAAAYLYFAQYDPVPEPAPAPAEPSAEPEIRHPVPEPEPLPEAPPPEPLPPLDESDEPLQQAIAGRASPVVAELLASEDVVRRVVAWIDNLPREKLATKLRPVTQVEGRFTIEGPPDDPLLGAENFARYDPLARLLAAIPAQTIAAIYFDYYPLFQQAYEELGYPNAYFNDRLVEVIDHMLGTPEVAAPIPLTRPHVFYEYADPQLEALSAGRKILLRIGPDNAAIVKQKLRELRSEIAAATPGQGEAPPAGGTADR